ncbi:retrovirus-related pol polyprotein from transposon TNT 1-94 [Tanacetum coccineum]
MFMANLSSEDPIYDEAGPSYDSNTPFEVQDHDTFVDHMDEYHEVHEMQSDVQHNYVVDSDADYTSDSNIIPYDQYVEDNEEHVVQSNVSSVRNDALMSILDEMHEQGVQSMSANKQVKVVNDTLTSELARYKELVGVYEQRAKFELTDRERKIDEQMRIIISDRNRKETSLKSELHSAQLQLRSTLNHHKIMREEAIILKKDFKQKEDKFLEEFLDIKRLKEKVEEKVWKWAPSPNVRWHTIRRRRTPSVTPVEPAKTTSAECTMCKTTSADTLLHDARETKITCFLGIFFKLDDDIHDFVTRISKLDISDPLHLHHNDTTALTVISIKLKGIENYQVWSCAMLLALEGKNKIGFIDGSCKRSNTDEVLGKQWDRVNVLALKYVDLHEITLVH